MVNQESKIIHQIDKNQPEWYLVDQSYVIIS